MTYYYGCFLFSCAHLLFKLRQGILIISEIDWRILRNPDLPHRHAPATGRNSVHTSRPRIYHSINGIELTKPLARLLHAKYRVNLKFF